MVVSSSVEAAGSLLVERSLEVEMGIEAESSFLRMLLVGRESDSCSEMKVWKSYTHKSLSKLCTCTVHDNEETTPASMVVYV